MKQYILFFIMCASVSLGQTYKDHFTVATMRVDYYRTGTKEQERITLDKVYEEGAWPGSRGCLIDTLNLGDCFLEVRNVQGTELLYSRGYSTMFGEWQTTDEAIQGTWKTFHETVRFPYPKQKVKIRLFRRNEFVADSKTMAFREIYTAIIDPNDRTHIDCRQPHAVSGLFDVMINGPIEKKVDILILGDGYTKKEMQKFRKDAKHFTQALFSCQPFKKHMNDFNVRAREVISEDSGIDMPDKEIWKRTAFGTTYNTFGSPRYVLTEENKAVREIADAAPYDFITILVNDNRYGGGGIFNLYTTCFAQPVRAGQEWEMDYVYVHEFGHCFGGLGDEYYSSQVSYVDFYPQGIEPWEPNITRTHTKESLKWRNFVAPETPVPTPWQKSLYDSIETVRRGLDRRALDYYEKSESFLKPLREILTHSPWGNQVGAFEGAGYTSSGMYRPALDCKMFALNPVGFDPVCTAAIERMIELYTK